MTVSPSDSLSASWELEAGRAGCAHLLSRSAGAGARVGGGDARRGAARRYRPRARARQARHSPGRASPAAARASAPTVQAAPESPRARDAVAASRLRAVTQLIR